MYTVRKLDVTRLNKYGEEFSADTWRELMDDLARRSDYGSNGCFYGLGSHVFRGEEFIAPLDVLASIDKPYRQTTLAEVRDVWADDCRNE